MRDARDGSEGRELRTVVGEELRLPPLPAVKEYL